MSDELTDAITTNITSPNSVSNDGVTVTNNRITEQIEGKKFLSANDALTAIAGGGVSPFVGMRIVSPGARGGNVDDDC